VINLTRGILKASLKILGFQVRQFPEDLLTGQAGYEKIEHIRDADTHPPDAGTPAALIGVGGDPGSQVLHASSVPRLLCSASKG
jgi:hypothetical protein